MMERHILMVFPHPDDEAFGTSGFISLQTNKGVTVTYACATLGEMGRNMGKPFFANRETLPQIRKKELEDACRVMGINDLRLLGYRDKTLEFENLEKVADVILEIISETNPSLIITFYPGYAVHPDHDACGEAVIRAVARLPKENRPNVYCKAFSKNAKEELGEPDLTIDVSDVIDQKIDALKAHRSQTERMFIDFIGNKSELLPSLGKEEYWYYKWN